MHLTAKFHHNMFNRSAVIVQTNRHTDKQSDKQTDAAENISIIHLASPMGNQTKRDERKIM